MKRYLFFFPLLILGALLWGKTLFLKTAESVCVWIAGKNDISVVYTKADYDQGRLCFYDLRLEGDRGNAYIDRAEISLSFSSKILLHLHADKASFQIKADQPLPAFSFTKHKIYSIEPSIDQGICSITKKDQTRAFSFSLNKNALSLCFSEESKIDCKAPFTHIVGRDCPLHDLSFLASLWSPDIPLMQGKCSFEAEKKERDIAFTFDCTDVMSDSKWGSILCKKGHIEGIYPLQKRENFPLKKCYITVEKGSFAHMQEVEGFFSYHPVFGCKGIVEGMDQIPFLLSLRGFFPDKEQKWVDLELSFPSNPNAQLRCELSEEKTRKIAWEIDLGSEESSFFYRTASYFSKELQGYEIDLSKVQSKGSYLYEDKLCDIEQVSISGLCINGKKFACNELFYQGKGLFSLHKKLDIERFSHRLHANILNFGKKWEKLDAQIQINDNKIHSAISSYVDKMFLEAQGDGDLSTLTGEIACKTPAALFGCLEINQKEDLAFSLLYTVKLPEDLYHWDRLSFSMHSQDEDIACSGWHDFSLKKSYLTVERMQLEGKHPLFSWSKGKLAGHGWIDWKKLDCRYEGEIDLPEINCHPQITCKDLHAKIFIDTNGCQYCLKGLQTNLVKGDKILLCHMPCLSYEDKKGFVDLRLSESSFDIIRICADINASEKKWELKINPKQSMLFDKPIAKGKMAVSFDGFAIERLQTECDLEKLQSFCLHWIPFLSNKLPKQGNLHLELLPEKIQLQGSSILFSSYFIHQLFIDMHKEEGKWKIKESYADDLLCYGLIDLQEKEILFTDLQIEKKDHFSCKGSGKLKDLCHFYGDIKDFSYQLLSSRIPGEGYCMADLEKNLVSLDLDFQPASINYKKWKVTNQHATHFHYDNKKGIMVSGIDCNFSHKEHNLSNLQCKITSLSFSRNQPFWSFDTAQCIISTEALHAFYPDGFMPITSDFEVITHGKVNPNFSEVLSHIPELYLPVDDKVYPLEEIDIHWDKKKISIDGKLAISKKPTYFDLAIDLESLNGKCTFAEAEDQKDPLNIEWTYDNDQLHIDQIQGYCNGIEAHLFATDSTRLIGSVHFDFDECATLLPKVVQNMIDSLELGKGFTCKGSLSLYPFSFKGLFTGKDCVIKGYQFQTLLSQMELSADEFVLFDWKLSDKCGLIKSDYIAVKRKNEKWEISIPSITLNEFRPSLLQKEGEKTGNLDPFLIRELQLHKFHGIAGDKESFTGEGNFHFINSFKREHSLLDLPSDFLGRIFGLDLELLIPVCGDVSFFIKDAKISFLEMTDAFSENKRSKFFLLKEKPPYMDFDGNLSIHIKMKHYVLFTFTEHFIITIDGRLLKPEFHLKRKKSLFL